MARTHCPNCDKVIEIKSPRVGAALVCPECDVDLEVISVSPFEVDFPLDDDWDDDDTDDWN
ncbi:MAG: lysine biosynthesis protein LysW [Chloroflexi bacterium]|nr:lysine biosynthesis protein LysW [Chloroflexota bacterium]